MSSFIEVMATTTTGSWIVAEGNWQRLRNSTIQEAAGC